MQQEFSKTFQKCTSYARPKLLHRKNSLSTQYRRYSSVTSENYFLTEHVSTKNPKKGQDFGSAVSETKRELRPYDPSLLSAVSGVREENESVRGERECESFFRDSTFRIAGRENLAARRRDLLDACRAAPCEIYCRPSLALRAEVGLSSRNSLLRTGTSRQLLTPRKVYFEKCTANAGLLAVRRKTFHASRIAQLM